MKNEIKEILEYIDQFVYSDQTYNDIKLSKIDAKLILDYITSLERQVQDLKADYGSKSQVERNLLEQENQRLKEEIENLTHIVANKIIEDYDIDTPLKNQLNEERIKYINLGVVCNDYKSRCEKALEYNDKNIHSQTLNNILRGDKDE